MVGTIIPIGYGERHEGRLALAPWLYTLGNTVGAAGLGGLLGAFGAALWHMVPVTSTLVTLLASGVVSLLYSLRELSLAPMPAPQFTRQVPAGWRGLLPPRVAALLYGVVLGGGLATRITVTTFHVVALWAMLGGNIGCSALVMGTFGLGRALPVLWLGVRGSSLEEACRLTDPLIPWQPLVHLVNGLALAFVGSWLLLAGLAVS